MADTIRSKICNICVNVWKLLSFVDFLDLFDTSSSSSSSESDEEFTAHMDWAFRHMNLRERLVLPRTTFDYLDDKDFEKRFRLPREMFSDLLDKLRFQLEFMGNRNNPIPAQIKLLITLRYYATGAF